MRPLYLSLPQRLALSCAAMAPLMAAAAPGAQEGQASPWALGIAAISKQQPYAGMDRETRVLPLLSYENSWFKFSGLGAEIKLPRLGLNDKQSIDFRLLGRFDMGGYEADDAPILKGMDERKSGFWMGAKATWRNDVAHLSADWSADASGHSKGQRFGLSLEKTLRFGPQLMLTPRLGATWLDKKYVDYYFGVRSHEANAGRAAHTGKAGVNTELGLHSAYLFDRHHSMFLDVGVTRLAKEIKNSPLVDRSTENRVLLGYLYRF
ncbi:MipA/OmpV family protein [Roseateles sp. NT4]|uniref:MipA/OmpV family protein n=1 Tax=Roseateles sp. NT4 TaxID=3453715 RepID=UPI003EEF1001